MQRWRLEEDGEDRRQEVSRGGIVLLLQQGDGLRILSSSRRRLAAAAAIPQIVQHNLVCESEALVHRQLHVVFIDDMSRVVWKAST